jgi:tyrosine-protein kinase Etk/Wzc
MAVSENAELEELIRKASGDTVGQLTPTPGLPPSDDQDDSGGLDLSTLVLVARRSLLWVVLLLTLGFTASWLFLRYTKPIYKAASILKLDERSEAANLGFGAAVKSDANTSNQLAGEIELIKSNLTYKNLRERLALDVNYYVQGTVLETELYSNSPFRIEHKISDTELYNRKFLINFLSPDKYQISTKVRNQTLTGTYTVGQWAAFPGMQLLLNAVPGRALPIGDDPQYHFVILNDGAVSSYLDRNLDVAVVNPNANTIQISFTDNNPEKASHIINSIDTVYLQEKLDRKKQSSALSLKFIDQVIADNDKRWRAAEEAQKEFVRRNLRRQRGYGCN